MICENCGGEYKKGDIKCPFCGRENEAEAERIRQEKYAALLEEENEIKKLPEKRLRTSTIRLLKISGILLAAAVVLMLLIAAGRKLYTVAAYQSQTKRMEQLETYYINEDFEGLASYMDENNLYGSRYTKYEVLSDAYHAYSRAAEWMLYYEDTAEEDFYRRKNLDERKELMLETMNYITEYSARACRDCTEGMERYGEYEDVKPLQTLLDKSRAFMKERLLYTDAEIEELCALEEITRDTVASCSELAFERLEGEEK